MISKRTSIPFPIATVNLSQERARVPGYVLAGEQNRFPISVDNLAVDGNSDGYPETAGLNKATGFGIRGYQAGSSFRSSQSNAISPVGTKIQIMKYYPDEHQRHYRYTLLRN